jgi:hypothetical protein
MKAESRKLKNGDRGCCGMRRRVRIHPGRPGVNPAGSEPTGLGGRFIAVDWSSGSRQIFGSAAESLYDKHPRIESRSERSEIGEIGER